MARIAFGATVLLAGEHDEGMLKIQNEKEIKMACTIPLANLNLTPEQRKKMDRQWLST
jgi:hypothetical protein